jgi:hypothetical protein
MPVQTRLQKKLLEFQSLDTNQINHQNPTDFQALISPTLSNNMASQSAVNQPNPPPPPVINPPRVNNLPPPIVNLPPPPNPIIDPMMLPRGLPIIIPQGLMPVTTPVNLPKFTGTRNEDPAAHVERFVEVLITSLVTNPNYYLVWFPTTLDGSAYAWYRSHNAGTFASWQELQVAFLW